MNGLAAALLAELDPEALDELAERLAPRLAGRLGPADAQQDGWLTTRDAAAYVGRTATAMHKLLAGREIPCSQDGPGARCYFRRSDLDAWMRSR